MGAFDRWFEGIIYQDGVFYDNEAKDCPGWPVTTLSLSLSLSLYSLRSLSTRAGTDGGTPPHNTGGTEHLITILLRLHSSFHPFYADVRHSDDS